MKFLVLTAVIVPGVVAMRWLGIPMLAQFAIIIFTLMLIGAFRLKPVLSRADRFRKEIVIPGDFNQRVEMVEEYLEKSPFASQAVRNTALSAIHCNEGLYEKALLLLEEPLDQTPQIPAIDAITTVLAVLPYLLLVQVGIIKNRVPDRRDSVKYVVNNNKGLCYFALGETEKGLELYNECAKIFVKWKKTTVDEKGLHLIQQIVISVKTGKSHEAREFIKQCTQLGKTRFHNDLSLYEFECDIIDGLNAEAKEKLNTLINTLTPYEKHLKIQAESLLEKIS